MAVTFVSSQTSFPDSQNPSHPQESTPANPFWNSKRVANSSPGLTNLESKRLFSRLIGFGMASTGVGVVSLAALGIVAWPVGVIAIPCIASAAGLVWYSVQIEDHENPDELKRFCHEAARMNLDGVIQAYGWNDTLRFGILSPELFVQKYRQQVKGKKLSEIISYYEKTRNHISLCPSPKFEYRVPSPRESGRQWHKETESMTFEEIIQTYPLEKLERYAIVESGELGFLKTLKKEYDILKGYRDAKCLEIENQFQSNTLQQKRAYDLATEQASQRYNDNPAVKELQDFELRYTKDRQAAQDLQNQTKQDARTLFDRAVASYTDNGRIPYANLRPVDKAHYDQQKIALQLAESQADTTARLQIEQIHVSRNQRLSYLGTEEARVKAERDRSIGDAKNRYDTDVNQHRQLQEELLRPVDAAFRSSANDFNGRYRAYLRITGTRRH